MNKYIDEVIAEFDKHLTESAPSMDKFEKAAALNVFRAALTEQERRIKEDIAAKIEEIRTKDRDWPSERLVGLHLVLDEILSLLTPLPSSTEE